MPGPERVRVVEILATGTNGGAQEHVFSLMTRLDTDALRGIGRRRCRRGSAVRKLAAPRLPVTVIDEPDDAVAVRALTAHLALVRPDVIHTHMYRADIIGTKAAIALGETRPPPALRRLDGPLVAGPLAEDRDLLRQLTPQMDQLIAVSQVDRAQDRRRAPDRRAGPAHLQRRRPPALRPPGAVLHAPRRVRDGARLADRRRRRPARAREGPPDADRGLAARPPRGARTPTC